MSEAVVHPASFKDPAGFVFERNGTWYRHLHEAYREDYRLLMHSGLYQSLVKKDWLIAHTEMEENLSGSDDFYKTLLPAQLPFISYPYEWSFGMLRDAALLTLNICLASLEHGLVLKDATAYNVQFMQAKPVFIDTASFQKYDETQPWIAYRQFCENFLAPLLLSRYAGTDLNRLLLTYPEGVPVEICARLLPLKSWFSLLSILHIHLQAQVKSDHRKPGHHQRGMHVTQGN